MSRITRSGWPWILTSISIAPREKSNGTTSGGAGGAGLAAEEAERRDLKLIELRFQRTALVEELDIAANAEAAALPSGATGVGNELVALEAKRVGRLDHLDRRIRQVVNALRVAV